MAVTTVETVNISQGIAAALDGIPDLRVYWYISDAVRPPALVIAQPSVDYLDNLSGFCSATWTFPMSLVVARNNDRDAQVALSGYLQRVTSTLATAVVAGVQTVEPVDARPITITVSGQELPGYAITVRVRA